MQPWEIASLADDGCQPTEGWMTVLSGWGGCFVIGFNGTQNKVIHFPWHLLRLNLWSCPSDGWWSQLMPGVRGLGD